MVVLKSQVQLQNWGCIGEAKTKKFGFSVTVHSHHFSKIKKFMLHSHWLKYFNIFLSFLFSLFSAPLCLSIFLYYLIFPLLSSFQNFFFFFSNFLSFFSNCSLLCKGLFWWVMPWVWVWWVINFMGHAMGLVWFLADLGLLVLCCGFVFVLWVWVWVMPWGCWVCVCVCVCICGSGGGGGGGGATVSA